MIEFFTDIGLTKYDLALIVFCPIGACIGSFAHAITLTINVDKAPSREGEYMLASKQMQIIRSNWLGLRILLGAILGLIIALYFIGSIQENISTICKISALSILAGYAAPKIWVMQEILLINRLENLINKKVDINQ